MEKVITPLEGLTPQQAYPGYPGVAPPKGWVPPLDAVMRLMGVFDNKKGVWVGLPLQAFIGPWSWPSNSTRSARLTPARQSR